MCGPTSSVLLLLVPISLSADVTLDDISTAQRGYCDSITSLVARVNVTTTVYVNGALDGTLHFEYEWKTAGARHWFRAVCAETAERDFEHAFNGFHFNRLYTQADGSARGMVTSREIHWYDDHLYAYPTYLALVWPTGKSAVFRDDGKQTYVGENERMDLFLDGYEDVDGHRCLRVHWRWKDLPEMERFYQTHPTYKPNYGDAGKSDQIFWLDPTIGWLVLLQSELERAAV